MPLLEELESWYTTAQAAHVAQMSRQAIIKAAKDGRVRAVQVGRFHRVGRGAWIFDPKSVEKLAKAHKEAEQGRELGEEE